MCGAKLRHSHILRSGQRMQLIISAITCRVCNAFVKKQGVLCQGCGLICHTSCATKASPRCDINEQLAMFARQQELLASYPPSRATSPQPSVEESSTPLTALPAKVMNGFKRSRAGLKSSTSSMDLNLNIERMRRSSVTAGKDVGATSEQPSSSGGHRDLATTTDAELRKERRTSGIRSGGSTAEIGKSTSDKGRVTAARVEVRRGRGRERDSRSECVVQ